MLGGLKDIERESDRIKHRLRRIIQLQEKRQVLLSTLSNEELISEVGSRTMPAAEIPSFSRERRKPKRDGRGEVTVNDRVLLLSFY